VAAGSGLGMELAFPPLISAQTPYSPDDALREPIAGNGRFKAGRFTAPDHDLAVLKQHTMEKQEHSRRYFPAPIRASQWS
jgi:hypothetical protein